MADRYPAYRSSRMRWLPPVPEHWNEQRAKVFFHEVDERSRTGDEELLSVSHLTGVTPRSQKKVTIFKAASYVGHKLCRPGDIVVNTLWAWMGALGAARHTGLVSPAYGVYRPHRAGDFNSTYLDYLLKTRAYVSEYIGRSTGVRASRLRLYPNQFLDINLIRPSLVEQDQIVGYLKTQDTRIARFIKNKREQKALLEEFKQRETHRILTGGRTSGTSIQNAGEDWPGSIPDHWTVVTLRQIADSLQTGPFGSQLHAEDYKRNGTPVINPAHIRGNVIVPDPTRAVDAETVKRLARHQLTPGDIIFARRGELGRCALVTDAHSGWLCGTGSLRLRLKADAIDTDFLMWVLNSCVLRASLRSQSVGATMENANTSIIGGIRVPMPPRQEQFAIANNIREIIRPIESAEDAIISEMDLIREYRARLIADVVTGQIDVRGWQPGPDDQFSDEDLAALDDDLDSETPEDDEDEND